MLRNLKILHFGLRVSWTCSFRVLPKMVDRRFRRAAFQIMIIVALMRCAASSRRRQSASAGILTATT
jgi:hypothetical protein